MFDIPSYTFLNGSKYVGEFQHDTMHGRARFISKSGKIQDCVYNNGQDSGTLTDVSDLLPLVAQATKKAQRAAEHATRRQKSSGAHVSRRLKIAAAILVFTGCCVVWMRSGGEKDDIDMASFARVTAAAGADANFQ